MESEPETRLYRRTVAWLGDVGACYMCRIGLAIQLVEAVHGRPWKPEHQCQLDCESRAVARLDEWEQLVEECHGQDKLADGKREDTQAQAANVEGGKAHAGN